jgi:L-iditol 2-dehydrogenase
LKLDDLPSPNAPRAREALVRIRSVGVCGSDLHMYQDARIGDTPISNPVCLGHEFSGVVESVGESAIDAMGNPLAVGARVAIDPAQHCGVCELCQKGHPNLCLNHRFVGVYPDDGALRELLVVPASSCFPVSDKCDFDEAALLEPLGIALHAVDLANIRVGDSVAILGAGPIGLLILQVAKLAGANPIFVTERLPWRLKLAHELGATQAIDFHSTDAVKVVTEATDGRGVDVAIEAAWSDSSVQQAADMARAGGRLVLVGIPGEDELKLKHSTIRRKGLTIRVARRMKHTYPRAIALQASGAIDLHKIISHRLPLERTADAYAMNTRYDDGVVKIMIHVSE